MEKASGKTAIVDPAEAQPVIAALQARSNFNFHPALCASVLIDTSPLDQKFLQLLSSGWTREVQKVALHFGSPEHWNCLRFNGPRSCTVSSKAYADEVSCHRYMAVPIMLRFYTAACCDITIKPARSGNDVSTAMCS